MTTERIDEILGSLSELIRTCSRVMNNQPKIFVKRDFERLERAKKALEDNAGYDKSKIPQH